MTTCNDPVFAEIALMIPDGNTLRLPETQLSHYAKIKKILQNAGGVYKRCAFVFKNDARSIQEQLCGGEDLNQRKHFQFFPTPSELAKKAVLATGLQPHHTWLEPSAGQGALADEAMKISRNGTLVELMPDNIKVLKEKGYSPIEGDFLQLDVNQKYDIIVANPPFSKRQDITHIRKMYDHLKPGGTMVSFASPSWQNGAIKAQAEFREWVNQLNAKVETIQSGAFKSAGTMIETVMITIKKPTAIPQTVVTKNRIPEGATADILWRTTPDKEWREIFW